MFKDELHATDEPITAAQVVTLFPYFPSSPSSTPGIARRADVEVVIPHRLIAVWNDAHLDLICHVVLLIDTSCVIVGPVVEQVVVTLPRVEH